MSSVSKSSLKDEEKRRVLIRISQFVLRDNLDEIRDDLQENIVEMALFWGTRKDQFISKDLVAKLVQKEIYFVDFPELMLDAILSRLLANGALEMDENGLYNLRGLRRIEIQQQAKRKEETINYMNERFIHKLEQEYGKKLSEQQKEKCLERFYCFLASMFIEKTELAARIITQRNIEALPTEKIIYSLSIVLAKISESELRRATTRTIKSMFREASEDFYRFLFSLAQNLTCIQILNLDPECQSLEKEAFSNKTLFLDTNVLIALLCGEASMHKIAEQLVAVSQTLGVKCAVTKRTGQEYLTMLEEANNIYIKWRAPYRFLEKADNEFLSSFWSEKKVNPSQSWKGFYYRMKQIESALKKHRISYFIENEGEIYKEPDFEDIKNEVDSCYRMIKGKGKSPRVREHDAFHLLLVRKLRKKQEQSLLGPNFWFATGDESLVCVDDKINRLGGYTDKTPSSMLCDLWLEMISPFLPISIREKNAYEAFSMLIKHQFAMIPFAIDTHALVEIQGSWMNYDWLETKDIVRIQNEEWVKNYIGKIREAKRKGVPPWKMEGLAKVFAKKLEKELTLIKDEKLRQLSKQMHSLSAEQKKLYRLIREHKKTIVNQQEFIKAQTVGLKQRLAIIQSQKRELQIEARFKRMMRIVSAVAGLFLIVSPPIFILFKVLPIGAATVTYCAGSLIVGAILLYFAIAYEKAKVALEAKLNIGKHG